MTSVLADLSQWAATLPYWEQAALDKTVAGLSFTDEDYDGLLQYLLEDAGLAEPKGERSALRFSKGTSDDAEGAGPVRLVEISNLQNVNALVPGQTLSFGPAMTAIYGANRSGKSGYARVLGCAGFTRGDREVLPDVTRPMDRAAKLSADIEILDKVGHRVIHYQVGGDCPELGSCYVLDSTSVRVHLTSSNALSFSPAGLSYLTRLAEVTDEVRARLKTKAEACSGPHRFDALFYGDSKVSEMIACLGPDTDLEALRRLAALSPDDRKRIGDLDIKIARLKTEDVSSEVADLEQRIADLELLTVRLQEALGQLGDDVAEGVDRCIRTCVTRQAAAQRVSIDQFRSEHFTQTGSDVWYRFLEAAKALADAEGTLDAPYPQADSHCLLCRQPLSAKAREFLLRLWALLKVEAQELLAEAENALEAKNHALARVELVFFDDQSVSYRHLQEYNPVVLRKVEKFITACHERLDQLLAAIGAHSTEIHVPALPENGIADVETVIKYLRARVDELREKDPSAEIAVLELEMRSLEHRSLLNEHLPEIEKYVGVRVWARNAERVGGSTRHITTKHNELFKQLVTDRYIELFQQTLSDFGRSPRVKVSTRARKGEVLKQIVVEADPSTPWGQATPDKVLSEGEKRAVALADFLTEVGLDTTSSAVILDDPVTSLDLEWRRRIAAILVNEAKGRQVIVFTHDLPFLYFLRQCGEQEQVDIVTHWIKRGDQDNRPGYVFLNNSPALERDYRKPTRASEIYAKAKDAPATEQEALLRDGFGALRTTYEAFIIFELFNEVVMRFDERISFGRLKGVVWDEAIANEVIAACERLSAHIEGHLHSDALGSQKPTLETLLQEIEAFEALRLRLKRLKKN